MSIDEYKRKVREHFESGNATDDEWEELTGVVLCASEDAVGATLKIDSVVYGSCLHCSATLYEPCDCLEST